MKDPSGDPAPGMEDIQITVRMRKQNAVSDMTPSECNQKEGDA